MFFRHKLILSLPIVVCFVVGTGLAFAVPREYVAHASVWADTRVPEESTVGTTGGQSPPAAGQATLLTQMLATRAFLRSVVQGSPLAAEYLEMGPVEGDRFLSSVGLSVTVLTPGPQLVSISVRGDDASDAVGIAESLLGEFERVQTEQAVNRAKAQVNFTKRQLDAARESMESLTRSDRESAQALFTEALDAYNNSTVALAAAEAAGVQIIDQPDIALPVGRRKTILFGAAGGLLGGATLSLLLMLVLMARDHSIRGEDELAGAGLLSVGSIPDFGGRDAGRAHATSV